jgi:hypothetical protein
VEHLEQYGRIRIMADKLGVESIDREAQTVAIKFRPEAQGRRLNVERLLEVVGGRGDTALVPPATVKLDLRAPVPAPPRVGLKGHAGGPAGTKAKARQSSGQSWWTTRATAGEVKAGFTKEAILKPPKEDPNAPEGVFTRVRGLLSELTIQ